MQPTWITSSRVEDGDHGKLRLLCSPPGLRLAELNASSVTGHDSIRSGHECYDSSRSEYKPRRQSPSCRRTHTPIPVRKALPKANVQSTSTRSGHKPRALPEVCTKHCRREYACRNRDLAVLLTNKTSIKSFSVSYGENCRNSLWITPCSVPELSPLHDVKTSSTNSLKMGSLPVCSKVTVGCNCVKSSLFRTFKMST
jgi:hypothetical protein